MPELPEVETIRRGLAPHVEGRTLESVEIIDPRWCRPLAPAEVEAALHGRRVERLSRRGKYLVWELTGDLFLLMHLRMTGTLLLDPPAPSDRRSSRRESGGGRHARVRLGLGDHVLVFDDPRRFGTGELALGPDALAAFFDARLGVEPLEQGFTAEHLYALARTSRAPVKAFLLDQKRVAGVGNIYADEALYRARVHPLRPANRLSRAQCAAIRDAVVESLLAGLEAKGATIDDFRDPYGVSGSFQDQFLVHLREGEPCPSCGGTVRKLRVGGRGTYVCERCQPRPRAPRRPRAQAAVASSASEPDLS
jgi:formamidopyrimidine-DNA glycosylase